MQIKGFLWIDSMGNVNALHILDFIVKCEFR